MMSFNREGREGCEEGSLLWEVLKLTMEDVKILISTAKIAKGREKSSVFWRLFAVEINF
jgi:hypothetical protein